MHTTLGDVLQAHWDEIETFATLALMLFALRVFGR